MLFRLRGVEAGGLRRGLALVAPLLLLACDKDKRDKRPTDDAGPSPDTGPIHDSAPGCDTGHLVDDGECVPASCGSGPWGNLDVDDSTVYVDATAAEGGDGGEAAPFTSIQAGLDAAGDADGGLVAVAAGTYPETLELGRDHDGVLLAGRCRELVVIDASVGDESTPGIDMDANSSEVEVSGVTVSGSRYVGVRIGRGTMTIRDCTVAESEYAGVQAYQAGIQATALKMEGCEVRGNTYMGVLAFDSGTAVTLRETAIEDTQPTENGELGFGIGIHSGASLDAQACQVRGNTALGVAASVSGTSVTLWETTIEGTRPGENEEYGYGIQVADGASLDAEGCTVGDNTAMGVVAYDSDTTVTLLETAIEDTQPNQSGKLGTGSTSPTARAWTRRAARSGGMPLWACARPSPAPQSPSGRRSSRTPNPTRTACWGTASRSQMARAWTRRAAQSGTTPPWAWPRTTPAPRSRSRRPPSRIPGPTRTMSWGTGSSSPKARAWMRRAARSWGTPTRA